MITGQVAGEGWATTATGQRVHYRLVHPDRTVANLSEMTGESKRWQALASQYRLLAAASRLPKEVARRASFADEVLVTVGINTMKGTCCNLVAQADDGRILGVAHYRYTTPVDGYVDLVAIAPDQMAGTPNPTPLRGVGTGMVAAIGQEYQARGVRHVYLRPLDKEAKAFWTGRGFHSCPPPDWRLCVEGPEIPALVGSCQLRPDCGDLGDCVVCGGIETTATVRVPALRASM